MSAKPIQHIVMLRLRADYDVAALHEIMTGLNALRADMSGILDFQHGPNRDFEQKSQDYPYGFICTFADRTALQTYADHPTHKQLGATLVSMCEGGVDGIWVADIEVSEGSI